MNSFLPHHLTNRNRIRLNCPTSCVRPFCVLFFLFAVEHSIVERLGAPQRKRVVKLQQVDATTRIHVASGEHLKKEENWEEFYNKWRNYFPVKTDCTRQGYAKIKKVFFCWRKSKSNYFARSPGAHTKILTKVLISQQKMQTLKFSSQKAFFEQHTCLSLKVFFHKYCSTLNNVEYQKEVTKFPCMQHNFFSRKKLLLHFRYN